jgi:ABC-2 type transport system permease protein
MKLLAVFKAVTKNWLRSRSGLFFSFLFPVIFLLVFGSIFGSSNSATYQLYVQNKDFNSGPPGLSQIFVNALNSTHVLSIKMLDPSVNATSYVRNTTTFFNSEPRILIIPGGFQQSLLSRNKVNLTFISSPADQSAQAVWGVITNVAFAYELKLQSSQQLIGINSVSSAYRTLRPVDYYIPGLTAAFMMTNGVIGLTSVASEFRRRGFLRRLFSTPVTKSDWILGNVLSQTILAILLTAVMIILGIAIYHSEITVNIYSAVSIFAGAILFSGIGMTLAGLVSDPEAASGLGNAIAFPMMFLSGTFWPLDIMPPFLQSIAKFLPLTYFAESLRDSMLLQNYSAAILNTGVTAAFALIFIFLGSKFTRWREP